MAAKRIYRVRARGLADSLGLLYDDGSRLPAFTVGEYRVSYSPSTRRLYARRGLRFLGSISRGGIYRPSDRATKVEIATVTALVENPLDVARGAAILSGLEARCPICGRKLDSKDRLRGIGPACYEKGGFQRLETKKITHTKKGKKHHGKNRRH